MLPRGFTLAELLVVIALMATLAAIAVPQLSAQEPQQLDAATAEVRAALRFARHEALQKGTPIVVDMETQVGTVKLRQGTCESLGATVTDPRTGGRFEVTLSQRQATRSVALSAQVLVAEDRSYQALVFDATGAISEACDMAAAKNKGTPRQGSQIVLTLGEHQQRLTLWPMTGRVSGP